MDSADYQKIYLAHSRDVRKYVSSLLNLSWDTLIGDDIAQNAWIEAWLKRDRVKGDVPFYIYVKYLARFQMLRLKRKHVRRVLMCDIPHNEPLMRFQPQLERMVIANQKVERVIPRCPARDREIVQLYIEGYSTHEIAEMQGSTMHAISCRISRVKRLLRPLLA